jgi:hypothetical protein
VGLGGLGLAILAAPAAYAAAPSCTWTDTTNTNVVTAAQGQSPPPVLQANVGDVVSVSCTDLAATLAVVFSSPLAGVIQPTAAQIAASENPAGALTNIAALNLGFGGGTLPPTNVNITSGTLGSDPNAQCPPTQAQVDAGLTNCALAVATAAAVQESVVLVNYAGAGAPTNPSPTAPSLSITNGANGFVGGNTVNVADGPSGHWWSTLTTGAPNAGLGIPHPAVVLDVASTPTPAASLVTITPAVYVNGNCHGSPVPSCGGVGGTLTPPVLGGSFTWPNGLSSGSHSVTVFALDLAPAGTVGSTLGSPCPPSPVPCVNATALANQQAASVLSAGTLNPASGAGSAGNTLHFDVAPVDTQGTVLCEARFTNQATVNPYAGSCQSFGTPTGSSTGQSTGTLHVTLPITAAATPGANTIYMVIDPPSGPVLLTIPYTISSLATTCGPIAGGAPGCEADEIINQNVNGTALGLSQTESATGTGTPPNVFMSDVTLNGFQQTATGALNTDVVQDIRGTLVGWTVTAVFQNDLLNATPHGNHNTIPVSGFNWTPSVSLNVAAPPSGFLADVVAGATTSSGFDKSVANGGGGTARTLCSAAPGGGGGTFNCAAALTLAVPAGVAAGAYSAVLQITIT